MMIYMHNVHRYEGTCKCVDIYVDLVLRNNEKINRKEIGNHFLAIAVIIVI